MEEREEYRGFWFSTNTPKKVRDVIANCYTGREGGTRIRIHQGDVKTGRVWLEEHDVTGYVGRSNGSHKIPLLCNNRRSIGGGGILDHCILAVQDVITKSWLYKADNFKIPELRIKENPYADKPEYTHGVYRQPEQDSYVNELQAAFKSLPQAQHYVDFMQGKRMRVS